MPKNIAKCTIEVKYLYPGAKEKKLIISLPVLEIYEVGTDANKAD